MASLIAITQRTAHVSFSPEECLQLARACREAGGNLGGPLLDACETFAALFAALAMAACAESYGSMPEGWSLALVRGELTPPAWREDAD